MNRLITKSDILFFVAICIGLIGNLLIPTVGALVLIDELCSVIILFSLTLWLVKVILVTIKDKKYKSSIWISLLTIFLLFFSVITAKDIVLDTIYGSVNTTLYSCSVEKRSTTKGIISLDCYLNGEDKNGNEYTLKIPLKDYDKLNTKSTINIDFYEHTQRIINY